ncbi:MAG: ATP-binding protein [Devosia nanyangense]|uniref:ATP-binding protein n=1 Tax=Devosia nanyangense TaxID=1228055 RepID=A0A933L315_9HYPH|nr:ATP-binding protein [Devosia nanyangense]
MTPALALRISHFRSLVEPVELPFNKKITVLAGPNNSGKSNVLRALAILYNRANNMIDDALDFDDSDKKIVVGLTFPSERIVASVPKAHHFLRAFQASGAIELRGTLELRKGATTFGIDENALPLPLTKYFQSPNLVLADFNSSGGRNLTHLDAKLNPESDFRGTTYVPNVRFITEPSTEPPQFVKHGFPGETIAFGSVIGQLAELDRPSRDVDRKRAQFAQIEDFLAYCLDCRKVSIQVPTDRSTIRVNVDGDERPLGNLGTGVEQLTIIGLAAIGFPERLVLIDEPELHLHPTSQRRIVRYLNESVDARFVIATHSASIMDTAEADIIQVARDGGRTTTRTIASNTDHFRAVRDLGHSASDLVQTRFAIWAEGPSDRIYLNNWIHRLDPTLSEGIDYTILFYGGSVLSQHSFSDEDADLVQGLYMSRSFAIVIDSDRTEDRPNLRPAKTRVKAEAEQHGGFCWITEGREMENYISPAVMATLAGEFSYATVPAEKRGQVLDPDKANKARVARRAVELFDDVWPLDLRKQVEELVLRINAAK